MKLVQAYIKTHKVSEVSNALHDIPSVSGMTTCSALGWGRGKQLAEKEHREERVREFEPHVKVEVCCRDDTVEQVVDAIRQAAHTGLPGDGLITIFPVEDAMRISTAERGEQAP